MLLGDHVALPSPTYGELLMALRKRVEKLHGRGAGHLHVHGLVRLDGQRSLGGRDAPRRQASVPKARDCSRERAA